MFGLCFKSFNILLILIYWKFGKELWIFDLDLFEICIIISYLNIGFIYVKLYMVVGFLIYFISILLYREDIFFKI